MRWVVHVDLDAFYASVEELDHPEWQGAPLVVGPDPQGGRARGVVTTANYEARKFGIRSAMPISQAFQLCPHARFVYPRFPRYAEKSAEVFRVLRAMFDVVEPASIDEGYADASSRAPTFADAVALARALQQRIRDETGLSASVGVAASKLVAKIATDMRKPFGLTAVTPGTEEEFLAPLPARKIPGVGPKTEARLVELGIVTCADLAAAAPSLLAREFGSWGPRLGEMARGIDASPVEVSWQRKSLGSETTFEVDEADPAEWDRTLHDLAEELSASLKEESRVARTVTLKVRLQGFETHTRARTLPLPVSDAATLARVAVDLLREFAPRRPVRLLGLRVTGLEGAAGEQATIDAWPADLLGESPAWRPAQRRLDEA